jgi:hypothetical protein
MVDGRLHEGRVLPVFDDGRTHKVEILLGQEVHIE